MTDATISVLVVDDEEDIVEVTRGCLEMKGFATSGVTSGTAAIEFIRRTPPDIVVLDIMMPGMDGVEVLKRLRAEEATTRLPVVVLSALIDAENVIRCFDEGADDYIVKPPDFDEMSARLRRHVTNVRRANTGPPVSPSPGDTGRLKLVETAIKQISLAAQLAQETDDEDFRISCLERIRGFCAYAIRVMSTPRE